MEKSRLYLPLLDYLGYRAESPCLSDLRHPGVAARARMLKAVEELAPEDASLWEWNDALIYLTSRPKPASDAAQARSALLDWLKRISDA